MPDYIWNGIFAVSGTLLGAVLTGIFAYNIAKANREKKEVTLSKSRPSSLLIVDGDFKEKLTIQYLGKDIETLLISEIFVSNTGNTTVQNIHVTVNCQETATIVSADLLDQATEGTRDGGEISLEGNTSEVFCDFLNVGEEISLRVLSTGDTPDWKFNLRQPGLNVVEREATVTSYSEVLPVALIEVFKATGVHSMMEILYPSYRKMHEKLQNSKSS